MPSNIMQMLLQSLFGQQGSWARRDEPSQPLGYGRPNPNAQPAPPLFPEFDPVAIGGLKQDLSQLGQGMNYQWGQMGQGINSGMNRGIAQVGEWGQGQASNILQQLQDWNQQREQRAVRANLQQPGGTDKEYQGMKKLGRLVMKPSAWGPISQPKQESPWSQKDWRGVFPAMNQSPTASAALSPAEIMTMRAKYQSRPMGVGDIRVTPLTGAESRTREDLNASLPMQHAEGQYGRIYGDRPIVGLDIHGQSAPSDYAQSMSPFKGVMLGKGDVTDRRYSSLWDQLDAVRQASKAMQDQKVAAAIEAMKKNFASGEERMVVDANGAKHYVPERFFAKRGGLGLADQDAYTAIVKQTYAHPSYQNPMRVVARRNSEAKAQVIANAREEARRRRSRLGYPEDEYTLSYPTAQSAPTDAWGTVGRKALGWLGSLLGV
jgi:hypothetical protein